MPQAEKTEIPNKFGDRLRWFRNQRGISQTGLGKSVNRTATSISEWEKGESQPSLEQIAAMASVLGVSPERLAFGAMVPQTIEEVAGPYDASITEQLTREAEAEFRRLLEAAGGDPGQIGWLRHELRLLRARSGVQSAPADKTPPADQAER